MTETHDILSIIVLGSNGMLGSMIKCVGLRRNKKIIPIARNEFDVMRDDIETLSRYTTTNCCIINCIGAIPQKSYSEKEYTSINVDFPRALSSFCKNRGIPLFYMSTNCVFSGNKEFCIESDIHDATDIYGFTKYKGEPEYGIVIRSTIIGLEHYTKCGLFEWFCKNTSNEISGYADHFWNGVTTLELSNIIYDMIDNNEFDTKIRHIYSELTVSKYDLILMIKRIFRKEIKVNPVSIGTKHYTLKSLYTTPSKSIELQLYDLHDIAPLFYSDS